MLRGLFIFWLCVSAASADPVRLALFNAELDRKGPGILLRDIALGKDEQIAAVIALFVDADADAVLILRFDWDYDGAALRAFAERLAAAGLDYPYRLALRPNTGMETGLDLDGDGRFRGPRDMQGYGLFPGQNGMALLSRWPIDRDGLQDFSALLWRDLPDARMPKHADGAPFPTAEAQEAQRLSAVGHWAVPLILPGDRRLEILAYHASPPVFDGPEDANGLRNADEQRLWQLYLSGELGPAAPTGPVVLMGGGNVDPDRGEGRHEAIQALLRSPVLQDPIPVGDATVPTATVDWTDIADPPLLRVDYILPDRSLRVVGSGVLWPPAPLRGDMLRHGLVWVDLDLP